MKTIIDESISEMEVNKSRFITLLLKVKSLDEVKTKLENIKKNYKDATHYCYAYIIDDRQKSSDGGEPGGTAGIPIMEVLLKNELNYILAVVVRYFGGIKLGTSVLVRSYSKAITIGLGKSKLIELIPGYKIKFNISYDKSKRADYLLQKYKTEKKYLNNIHYTIYLPQTDLKIVDEFNYVIEKELYIEKN